MTHTQRAILGAAVAAVVGFGLGTGWQYSKAVAYRAELDATRASLETASEGLTFKRLEATLGAATVEAQRGNHESARRLASDFFTGLQAEVVRAPESAQAGLREILVERDGVITALSRASAESVEMLTDIFARYRQAVGEPIGTIPSSPTEEPSATEQPSATEPTGAGGG